MTPLQPLIAKAAVLQAALPFLQRYRGQIFVIKYGGSFMDSPDAAVRAGVARDIVLLNALGIKIAVVHGGGKAITRAMDVAGLKATFIQGMRVTDEPSIKIVDQVLSREINPEIVKTIESLGALARGFPGTSIFTGEKLTLPPMKPDAGPQDLGFVGEVTGVDATLLHGALDTGIIPVISPTAMGEDKKIYNCNADVAAAQVAIALRARQLIFMSDVPGLLRDPKNPDSLIALLHADEIKSLKQSGVIDHGMIPKMDSAVAAVSSGVEKVSLIDGRIPHSLLLNIFASPPLGTELRVQG